MFYEKGALRKFTKFTGKHLYQSLFFNKTARLRPAILLKKRPWERCFFVNFAKFLRTLFLQNTSIMIVSTEAAHPENLKKKGGELLTLVTNSVFRHDWETKKISVEAVYIAEICFNSLIKSRLNCFLDK